MDVKMADMNVYAFFKGMCPNCEGEISDLRLSMGIPCNKCLPVDDGEIVKDFESKDLTSFRKHVLTLLKRYGTLKNYEEKLLPEIMVEELDKLFSKATQSKLWSAQRTWAKRLLSGKSFTIVAPTGMGKTVFGIFVSLYLARKGLRCYIMLPTTLLVQQVSKRLLETIKSLRFKVPVASYHSLLSKKKAEEELQKIEKGEFRILVTTSSFIVKRFDLIKDKKFDFLFVDDVDAFLKSSKNIDKVLLLLGFEEKIVEDAFQLIRLRSELRRALRQKTDTEAVNRIRENILEIEKRINGFIEKGKIGTLVVSGASIRARRTKRVKLFRELLGFEVTSKFEALRNIEDLYLETEDLKQGILKVLRVFGGGGLIFVPMDKGAEFAEEVSNFLVENGVKATVYKKRKSLIQDYVDGKYDVLVGVASPRSPLVRGLDLPERIRYVVFAGVPKFKISLDIKEFRPEKARILLVNLRDFLPKEEQDRVDKYLLTLRRYSTMLRRDEVIEVAQAIIEGRSLQGFLGNIQKVFMEIQGFLEDILGREEVKKKIEESSNLSSETVEGKLYLIIPDSVAYVQGSGRASRMYIGKISKGASIVVVDDKKAFNGLVKELKWFIEDLEWKSFDEADLKNLIKEIDSDRENIKRIREGKITPEFKDPTRTALLVVESPNKARTIARFFGRPTKRTVNELTVYEINTGDLILNIAATGGHVFD
ncbi:MAG: reverse gyrase, partial [Candidatus Hecatellales archaeon]